MGVHPGCSVCSIVAASLVAVETDVGETISAAKVTFVCGLRSVRVVALLSAGPSSNTHKTSYNTLVKSSSGGRNSSVGSAWARCHSVAGSILLWGHFLVEGIFPLELTYGFKLHSPQNSFGWEYKPRSSLCTHAFHRTDSKDLDAHVLDGWMPATKTLSTHHPRRRNVTTLMVGLKNGHIRKNLTQKWWTPEI